MKTTRTGAFLLLALMSSMFVGCATPMRHPSQTPEAVGIDRMQTWMSGEFSSAKHASEDPEYFDIRLHIKPIWTERTDGPWLYVEQARSDAMEKPYRQRVYRLSAMDGETFRSEVFEFSGDPLVHAGAWKSETPLAGASPEALKLKDGCAVVLGWKDGIGQFAGGTDSKGCPSALRGAAYATSEVILTPNMLLSWDRGYDAAGKQVWGATKGGYRFLKAIEVESPTLDVNPVK